MVQWLAMAWKTLLKFELAHPPTIHVFTARWSHGCNAETRSNGIEATHSSGQVMQATPRSEGEQTRMVLTGLDLLFSHFVSDIVTYTGR